MTGRHPRDLAASVRQRLLNKAHETNRPFNELLQHYAMERFLYRLSRSQFVDKFVLKGALMFAAWRTPVFRPTMDIDLLGRTNNRVDMVVLAMKDICLREVEPDGLAFDTASAVGERIAEGADYEGVRVRLRGSLGVARFVVQVDVGFGDVIVPRAFPLQYPTLLDMPAPQLQGYSRESTIAEKFQVMTRLGVLNSRIKDFFDVWLLSRRFEFDGQTLAMAITRTFANRDTEIASRPVALTAVFCEDSQKEAQWRSFLRRNRLQGASPDLRDTVSAVAAFLRPVSDALASHHPFGGTWPPGGPWLGPEEPFGKSMP